MTTARSNVTPIDQNGRVTRRHIKYLGSQLQVLAQRLQRGQYPSDDPELNALLDDLGSITERVTAMLHFVESGSRQGPKYGLTEEQFWALVDDQAFGCAICDGEFAPGKRLLVDHNHRTTEVRGILCSRCNSGLGFFLDSPDLLDRAMAYLDERGHYGASIDEEVDR